LPSRPELPLLLRRLGYVTSRLEAHRADSAR
jgi:hypothetical protein